MAVARITLPATPVAPGGRRAPRCSSFRLINRGKPVPFYVTGRAKYNGPGIDDVLNLDGTGPELLQQDWAETNWMPDSRSGYYIFTLYQQRGIYGYRADGRHGTRSFRPREVGSPGGHAPRASLPSGPSAGNAGRLRKRSPIRRSCPRPDSAGRRLHGAKSQQIQAHFPLTFRRHSRGLGDGRIPVSARRPSCGQPPNSTDGLLLS